MARVIVNRKEKEVPVEELKICDIMVVRPGDELIGSTVNQEGLFKVKATKIGKDTFLAQVIKMVEEYQSVKVPIQEFAERITTYFVPIILAVAASSINVVTNANLLRWVKVTPDYDPERVKK